MTKKYQIPFGEGGDQLDYPIPAHQGRMYWKDNFEFEDTLTLVAWARGRSSVTFLMQRASGSKVSVFVSDFFDMALQMVGGDVKGKFTFAKKGANYGCRLVQEARL